MIERHSSFYNFGKLLRESIECFGVEAHRSETKVFYHGIDFDRKIMNDDEIKSLFIYTPLSTSSLMEICLNNNSNQSDNNNDNSLILELKGYVSKYFDASWISDSSFEKEQIFFGGTRALTVNKCVDYKFGYDHKLFINSMKYIPNIFKMPMSEWKINKNDDMLQETKEMIRNLIFHQLNKVDNKYPDNLGKNGIPKEIEENLNEFSLSTKEVRMHYDAMYNHRAYGFLSSLFMTPTRTFTKLDIITTLFPNINTFSMMRVPLTTLTFMYLKSIISPPKPANIEEEKDDHKENVDDDKNKLQPLRCKISEIRLIDPKTAAMSIDAVIQSERKSLASYQWTIDSPDQVSLVLKYSNVPVIIKEPTPPPIVKEEKKEEKEAETEKKEEKKVIRKKKIIRKKKVIRKKPVKKPTETNTDKTTTNTATDTATTTAAATTTTEQQ